MEHLSRRICMLLILALLVLSSGCGKAAEDNGSKDPTGEVVTAPADSSGNGLTETIGTEQESDLNADTTGTGGEASNEGNGSSADPGDKPGQISSIGEMAIKGAGVDNALSLSLEDLKTMKEAYYEDDYFALNSYGTKAYFSFKGVKLAAILQKAGIKSSATQLTFIATDGYEQQITVEQALKMDYIDEQNPDKKYPVIIAWNENGIDYDPEAGLPFRLVIGQKEAGDVNKPQWVSNIAQIIVE